MKRLLSMFAALLLLTQVSTAAVTRDVGPVLKDVITTLVDGATVPWDASSAYAFKLKVTGDDHVIQNPTNLVAGQIYLLELAEDATGGHVVYWGNRFRFPGNASNDYNPCCDNNFAMPTAADTVMQYMFFSDGQYMTALSASLGYSRDVATPTSLTASTDQTAQVTLDWTDNASDETGYQIETDVGGGNWGVVDEVAANVHHYVDTSIGGAGDRVYRVRAQRKPSAFSPGSNIVTGTAL